MTLDARVAALAARQELAIATWQLRRLGMTPAAVEHRVAEGRLFTAMHGAYSLVPDPPLATRLSAGLLAGGRGPRTGHASGTAAAVLLGLEVRPDDEVVAEITVPLVSGRRTRHGMLIVHRADLCPGETGRVRYLPVTSAARTVADLAAQRTEAELVRMLDRARADGVLDLDVLRAAVDGRPGAKVVRAILDDGGGAARAVSERDAARILVAAGLPAPEINGLIGGAEFDLVWREERFVVELDSRAFHGAGDRVERDRAKERILRHARFGLGRFTRRQILAEPGAFVADVAVELALRGLRAR